MVYDSVVIGSGFGGAVASCRLAQAGQRVAILERGRRYPMHSFPRDWGHLSKGWLWREDQGLFDVKPINEMLVVQGAGYGGGSLIYANVHLRPEQDVFARGWPKGYDREALDPYFDLVGYMLDIKPIGAAAGGSLPAKALLMKKVAKALGREDQFFYPNIAVDLGEPGVVHRNKFGVQQSGCNHCGECDVGCNIHAKNTLDHNYLAIAERHGADVRTQCEVSRIAPTPAGYAVTYRDHRKGGALASVEATSVFVCAGAVNSTELLLRCRDEHRTLPRISPRIGHGYSANGDFLALAVCSQEIYKPASGPTITTGIVFSRGEGEDKIWFVLEEGGFPRAVAQLLGLMESRGRLLCGGGELLRDDIERRVQEAVRNHPGEPGANAAVLLAMGRDRADGQIKLRPIDRGLCVKWNSLANLALYSMEERLCKDVARALGGELVSSPFWEVLHQPVAVHNLGGCMMSDDPEDGVTDPTGQVYGYENLYVLDGALLPAATGVNPSSTIAAVAERNIEAIIRRLPGKSGWQAPERAAARPIEDPLGRVVIPAGGTALPETQALDLSFTETMKGFFHISHAPLDDYRGAESIGRRVRSSVQFTLTITIPDLDRFISESAHAGVANGRLHVDGITDHEGAEVVNGVFNLFVKESNSRERKMLYALPFVGADGKHYLLDGTKEVFDDPGFDVWSDTTTLFTVIREGHSRSDPVVATGVLHILLPDFLEQLTTFRVGGTDDRREKIAAIGRFGKMFMGDLWDVFARAKLSSLPF
ncbi:GMC family oxidoreductase [Sorangium sp. So ce291]|uniref:GMC oxidoreductase n=1 Tax=Sorangium sp. So ce291 TaxID=3133294 RepID=UPI003F6195C5